MRRFWITFDAASDTPVPPRMRLGVGVAAESEQAAVALLRDELVPAGGDLPPVREIVADVDVSTLDEQHVLRNIGVVTWRGIWWPPGFTRWHAD